MQKQEGFTIIEVLLVIAIIGVIAAIAIPGLLRARQSGNETSAIGSIRAITAGQSAYASACAAGGFAQNNADLAKAPAGGTAFISPDLEKADILGSSKSGYLVDVDDSADPANRDMTPAANTCNGSSANARMNYFVAADPVTRGQTGGRSFASDRRGTVFYDLTASIPNPIPAGAAFIQ